MFSNLFNSEKVTNYINFIINNLLDKKFNNLKEIVHFIEILYNRPKDNFEIDLLFSVNYLIEANILSKLPRFEENEASNETSIENLYIEYYNKYFPRFNELDSYEFEIIKNELIENFHKKLSWRSIAHNVSKKYKEKKGICKDFDYIVDMELSCASKWVLLKTQRIGEFVVGKSFKNGCELCKKILNGKIFRIGIKPEIMKEKKIYGKYNMSEENYYNNYIWEGKKVYEDIYSIYENKSIEQSENKIIFPNFPLHPLCDCNFLRFHPEGGYFNYSGELCMRLKDTEKVWQSWYAENIVKKFPEYKYEIEYRKMRFKVFNVYDIIFTKDKNIIDVSFKYDTNKGILEKVEKLKQFLFVNLIH